MFSLCPLAIGDGRAKGLGAGLKIATNSFTYKDLERLTKFLYDKYKLECSLIKTGAIHENQFNIYFLPPSNLRCDSSGATTKKKRN